MPFSKYLLTKILKRNRGGQYFEYYSLNNAKLSWFGQKITMQFTRKQQQYTIRTAEQQFPMAEENIMKLLENSMLQKQLLSKTLRAIFQLILKIFAAEKLKIHILL